MNTNLQGCGGSLEGRRWPFHGYGRGCQESRFGFVRLRIFLRNRAAATTIAKDRNARRIGLTRFALRDTQIPLSETCGT